MVHSPLPIFCPDPSWPANQPRRDARTGSLPKFGRNIANPEALFQRGDSAFLTFKEDFTMLKKLMITTAISGLMIGAAVAEGMSQNPPAASPTPPAASSAPAKSDAAPASSTEMKSPAGSEMKASASSAKFVNSQRQDQFLASKFKGTDVIGTDGQKIGDVSDILFDKTGKIEAFVLGVGGFLGIGAKDVALAPNAFEVVPGDKSKNESDKLKLAMTKDDLTQAANFEPYKAPSSTTGMAPATRPTPGGAPASRPQ